jgi:hypothetical protein
MRSSPHHTPPPRPLGKIQKPAHSSLGVPFPQPLTSLLNPDRVLVRLLPPRLVSLLPVLLAGLLLLAPPFLPLEAAPSKESFRGAPPLPAPANLSIDRKSSVRIALRVLGPQSEPVRFLLRTPPNHGTITLEGSDTGTQAWVEYHPPSDRAIVADRFGFAAANSKGVSAETFISLKITDRAGRVELPPRIEFPPTRVGSVSTKTIPLKNIGDALLSGTISAPPGWSCEPDNYRIEPQKELVVKIVLQPTIAGSLQGDLVFSHQPEQPVKLSAPVEEWIQAQPDPLKLFAISNSREREALLRLHNPEPRSRRVQILSLPPLEHPTEIELPSGESKEIPIRAGNLPIEPASGVLKLIRKADPGEEASVSRLLLWTAEASAPFLKIAGQPAQPVVIPPESPLFTPIPLENIGGSEGIWSIQTVPPFAVDSTTLRILPGKSIDLRVFTVAPPADRTEGTLKLVGNGQSLQLRLVTSPPPQPVKRPPSPPKPGADPTGPSQPAAFLESETASTQAAPANPQTRASSPPTNLEHWRLASRAFLPGVAVARSRLSGITHRSALLEMPCEPNFPLDQLRVEGRIFLPGKNGELLVHWVRMTEAKLSHPEPTRIRISFENLEPSTPYTIRVLGPSLPDGRRVALHQCEIITNPPPPWITTDRLLVGILVLASAAFAWHRARRA